MRPQFFICVIISAAFTVNAQLPNRPAGFTTGPVETRSEITKKKADLAMEYRRHNTKQVKSRWYNYALSTANENTVFNSNILFPDTTILLPYGASVTTPAVHGLLNIIDPSSFIYNNPFNTGPDEVKIEEYMDYRIDAVAAYGWYYRMLDDPDIVDTLVFEVVYDIPMFYVGDMQYFYFTQGVSQYFTDTLFIITHRVSALTGQLYTANKTIVKKPLHVADTVSTELGFNLIEAALETPVDVPAGTVLGVAVYFKPGYSWKANQDTLFDKNYFVFFSNEENGHNTLPSYFKGDFNQSDILTTVEKYDKADDWYGLFSPAFAFTEGYYYENHWIEAQLTIQNFSVEEFENNLFPSVAHYPNPAAENVTIVVDQALQVPEVHLNFADVFGRPVRPSMMVSLRQGINSLHLDIAGLPAGLYFYTLRAGAESVTRKMIVVD